MSAGTFIYYMYELNKIKNNIESKFRGNERERERELTSTMAIIYQ